MLSPYIWTAILFFIFSLPIFIWVKDKKTTAIKPGEQSYRKGLIASLKRASKIPGLLRFFVGRFFIVEAMETVILFMAVYLVKVVGFDDNTSAGFGLDEVTFFLIVITSFTIVGSYIWGILTQRFGPKAMLLWAVIAWLVALTGIVFFTNKMLLYLWGGIAGTGLGGIWTSDRPLMINLLGKSERFAEFFGLYALSGRLAAVIGPIIWGLIVHFAEPFGVIKYKFAIESLFIMMVIGLIILRKVPDAR